MLDIFDIVIEEIGDKSLLIVFEIISVILGIIVSSINLKSSTDKPLSNKHKNLLGNLFLWIGIVGLIFVFVKAIYTAFTYSSYSNQWINTETADIPDDAVSFKGHSYYLFDSVASSWSEVIQFSSDRGGYPVVINNKKENEFLFQYMIGLGKKRAFIGYTDKEKEDTWQWVYGMKSKFEDWGGEFQRATAAKQRK